MGGGLEEYWPELADHDLRLNELVVDRPEAASVAEQASKEAPNPPSEPAARHLVAREIEEMQE